MIVVVSGLADKNQVALWERHPAHPGGEVFIADDREHQVAETPAVVQRLRDGRLVKVEQAKAPAMVVKETPPPRLPDLRPTSKRRH